MASKTCNGSRPWNFDPNSTSETMYYFPVSPGEPGKFDFYRVHLSHHAHYSDPTLSNCSDVSTLPTLPPPPSSSSSSAAAAAATKKRWTPFADMLSYDESNSSTLTSSQSSNSISMSKPEAKSSVDSSALLNTNRTEKEPIQSAQSFSFLTDVVKNAMTKGELSTKSNQSRRPFSGTTLSSKDLNHLSPQSM